MKLMVKILTCFVFFVMFRSRLNFLAAGSNSDCCFSPFVGSFKGVIKEKKGRKTGERDSDLFSHCNCTFFLNKLFRGFFHVY